MKNLEWYFDFVSPFSYLAMEQSHRLLQNADVSFKPVLFAGRIDFFPPRLEWNNARRVVCALKATMPLQLAFEAVP